MGLHVLQDCKERSSVVPKQSEPFIIMYLDYCYLQLQVFIFGIEKHICSDEALQISPFHCCFYLFQV
jgi:hypothetical protein